MKSNGPDKWQNVGRIWEIIDRLRGEQGCPWDRKQTPESLQTYLLEESHETAAAIRGGQHLEVCEELGDLLFMVLFLVYLYEEEGRFGLKEVCDQICDKMIRRHPHVFGDLSVVSTREVKDNWEKIKAEEKRSGRKSTDSVPASLPALVRAYRMVSRLKGDERESWDDLPVRAREFVAKSRDLAAIFSGGGELNPEFLGEMILELVNLARVRGLRAEDCLHLRLMRLGEPVRSKGHE